MFRVTKSDILPDLYFFEKKWHDISHYINSPIFQEEAGFNYRIWSQKRECRLKDFLV